MEIERTFRVAPIQQCYNDPDIIEKIRHDGYNYDALLHPDFNKDIFLLGWTDDNQLIGMMKLEAVTNVTFRMHGCVLKHQRKYALELTSKLIEWTFTYTLCHNIITEIPSKHMITNNFMDKLSAKTVGIIPNNIMIDGVLYDTIIKQIQRKQ